MKAFSKTKFFLKIIKKRHRFLFCGVNLSLMGSGVGGISQLAEPI